MAEFMSNKQLKKRKARFKIMHGMFDFVALLVSAAIIALCVLLLVQLFRWLKSDVPVTFADIGTSISEAIVYPDEAKEPGQQQEQAQQ